MPYANRRVLDADAHLMEPPGWLESYVDPGGSDPAERSAALDVSEADREAFYATNFEALLGSRMPTAVR